MKDVAVVMAVAALGLAGCAGILPMGGRVGTSANCDGGGACKVEVSVTECVPKPDPDPLKVTGKNVVIFWELNNIDAIFYQFRDRDGVVLKTASSEFELPETKAFNKKFKMHDKNSLKAEPTYPYPYTINVQKLKWFQWVDCPAYDPIIVNQG